MSKWLDSDPGIKSQNLTILVFEKLGESGLDLLLTFGIVECVYALSPEDLCAKILSCDALIVRRGMKVTRKVFEAAKGRRKVVWCAWVGIDITSNTIAAAENGIALLADMAWNIAQSDASMKADRNGGAVALWPNEDAKEISLMEAKLKKLCA